MTQPITPDVAALEAINREMVARLLSVTIGVTEAMRTHYEARQAAHAPQEVLDAAADNLDRAARSARRTLALSQSLTRPARTRRDATEAGAEAEPDATLDRQARPRPYRAPLDRPEAPESAESCEHPEAPEAPETARTIEAGFARDLRADREEHQHAPAPAPVVEQDCLTEEEFQALPERIRARIAAMDGGYHELVIQPPFHRRE